MYQPGCLYVTKHTEVFFFRNFLFRKRRGRYFVDLGNYNLTIEEPNKTIPTIIASQLPSLVKQGSIIDMNIVLWHNG